MLCELGQGLVVVEVHDDGRFKRKSVLHVAYLVEDILHLLACGEELVERTVLLVAKADEVAALAVRRGKVGLIVMYLDELVCYTADGYHLAGEPLLSVIWFVAYA